MVVADVLRMIAAIVVLLFSESQPFFKEKPAFSFVWLYLTPWPTKTGLSLPWPPTALRATTEHRDTHDLEITVPENRTQKRVVGSGVVSWVQVYSPCSWLRLRPLPFLASRTMPDTQCLSGEHLIEWLKKMSSICYSNHVWLCYLEARMFSHLSLRVSLHSQAQITGVCVWRVLKTQGESLKHLFICAQHT